VTGFSGDILMWVGLDPTALLPAVLLSLLGHALAIAASTVLLLVMFKLLVTHSHVPRRAMVSGAVVGAVGFELLKLAANLLLAQTQRSPAFQAFGVALILLIWINYFSRLVMYAAAWSYTAPGARRLREAESLRAPGAALADDEAGEPAEEASTRKRRPGVLVALAAAVAAALGARARRTRADR
jgi:membrane protein